MLFPQNFYIASVADPDPGMDEQPGSYFLELRNHFFCFFCLNSLMRIRDPGSGMETVRIRDPGPGMEKSRIRDPG
jgi:hypothetical protein